jgi:hypothetical protein
MLTRVKHITRAMVRAEPDTLFVFGDNMERRGLGGQAREMRGEPNAVGIPTKRAPSMLFEAFVTDEDFDAAKAAMMPAFDRLWVHAVAGGKIVWPSDGIGTGLADLQKRAPRIWALIEDYREQLDRTKLNRED